MATAAALGHAARRLGGTGSGALRQTQEAAASRLSSAVEGRLMPRRLAHTEVQNPCPCGKFVNAAELKRIQKMTEELYEAVSGAHNKYWWKDQDRRMNTALLRQLSDHVCRRSSGDPTWEWARQSQLRHDLLKATGYVTLVYVGSKLWSKELWSKAFALLDESS